MRSISGWLNSESNGNSAKMINWNQWCIDLLKFRFDSYFYVSLPGMKLTSFEVRHFCYWANFDLLLLVLSAEFSIEQSTLTFWIAYVDVFELSRCSLCLVFFGLAIVLRFCWFLSPRQIKREQTDLVELWTIRCINWIFSIAYLINIFFVIWNIPAPAFSIKTMSRWSNTNVFFS